ncbi:DUF6376 family protein [Pseudoneobacillus rhizosphaerae]|uniref:Lipoprotein n=1 Tax=Pseudoneobacillus rhizosphaerae TaxID=2880968 RepID=A0A9C7LC41_9BACI|nr:DUF6376 family protein [Pseudoneobacillus rhizosphaerae]CAG9609822.1 hypothetical protein NEOCIP111885_03565 [Pseudoneobacillus rhizosphaerae]
MKKGFIGLSTIFLILLSGCSLLNDAKNTITYINDATDFLGKATTFANEAPKLAQQAITDQQAAEELQTILQTMKQDIDTFNELQAPDVAADLHQQLVNQNNVIAKGIDTYLNSFKDGKLDPAVLENTEIFQTVQELSNIIDQIKQLGQ